MESRTSRVWLTAAQMSAGHNSTAPLSTVNSSRVHIMLAARTDCSAHSRVPHDQYNAHRAACSPPGGWVGFAAWV